MTELLRLLSSVLLPRSKHPASSHSLVSSHLIHLPQCSFPPCPFTSLPPPTSLEFFLVSFISENSRPFMQSFHFSFHPSPPFLLSVARSAEKNKRKKRVRESPDHNRKRGTGEGVWGKATRADGDWKEHAGVLFCDIRGYTLRECVLKMWGLILSKGGLMQVRSDATLMIADKKRSTRVFHIVLGLFFYVP